MWSLFATTQNVAVAARRCSGAKLVRAMTMGAIPKNVVMRRSVSKESEEEKLEVG